VWARLLTQLPGARLFLRDKAFASRFVSRQFLERFRALGVEPARIRLEGAATRSAYLAGYNEADIALSPFPFGGGTTTAEALWMGVPVVALRGATWVGRISETILSSVGLADFVAVNEEDYIRIAVSLALDGRRRSVLRGQLRGMLRESSLCDAAAFTLDLEMAYRGMWREWCRGQ
jgi:predicted O-linked N-acetylglucosamine transferase (SPINDLY family)